MSQQLHPIPNLISQKKWQCMLCSMSFSNEHERDMHFIIDCACKPKSYSIEPSGSPIAKPRACSLYMDENKSDANEGQSKPHGHNYSNYPITYLQHPIPIRRNSVTGTPLSYTKSPQPSGLPPSLGGYQQTCTPDNQKNGEFGGIWGLNKTPKPKIMPNLSPEALQPIPLPGEIVERSRDIKALVAEVDTELCRVKLEGGLLGGYRCDILIENISEREVNTYKCARCGGIMKDCSISNRGEQLCVCCFKEGENSLSNESIRVTISSLKCSCPLSKRGCDWLGRLEIVEHHLTTCGFVNVSCELKCNLVTSRSLMGNHLKELCLQREVSCLHCSEVHKACRMEAHVNVCGKVEVLCELGCGKPLRRESMKLHKEDECPEGIVVCPYTKYKCEVVGLKRGELKQHLEKGMNRHLELKVNILDEETQLRLQKLEEKTNLKILTLEKDNTFLKKNWKI